MIPTQNPSSEKMPRAGERGASLGMAAGGNVLRQPHQMVGSMPTPSGKNHGSVPRHVDGTVPVHRAGSLPGKNQKSSSEIGFPKLGRRELINEWQAIVLQFSIKKNAEDQDATEKAIESQRNGDNAASLLAAANMARSNPRARAMIGRLFGFTGHYTDPDFMEGFEKLTYSAFARAHLEADEAEHAAAEACDEALGDLFGGQG